MGTGQNVRIDVLVFDGCPHADAAIELAHALATRLGPGISVERVDVDTPERAAELGFLGSPSLRVNGADVEGKTTSTGRLCCRTYEDGAGVPPDWLVEAAVLRALAPRGMLFLCVANSARSQIAEGDRAIAGPGGRDGLVGRLPADARQAGGRRRAGGDRH